MLVEDSYNSIINKIV